MSHWHLSRRIILLSLLLPGVACLLAWGWMDQQVGAAGESRDRFNEALSLETRILASRTQPKAVASRQVERTELARIIEQAARAAGLPPSSLLRIWPVPPRRMAESPYIQHSTQIILREVSLKSVAAMLRQLAASDTPFSASSLRLSIPPGPPGSPGSPDASDTIAILPNSGRTSAGNAPARTTQPSNLERWNVEVTVTYLTYSPTLPSSSSASHSESTPGAN